MGANGDGMHSLHAAKGGRVSISLLKTAPGNAQMSQLYNFQSLSAANWGRNNLAIKNPVTGDAIMCAAGAFTKQSDVGYSVDGGLNVWEFEFITIDEVLGNGLNPTGLIIP
jgi:hypothetical protein